MVKTQMSSSSVLEMFVLSHQRHVPHLYTRNKEMQQTKNKIFACLNEISVKYLLKISYLVFIACDEIPIRHFNATFYATKLKHMKTQNVTLPSE